MYTQLATIQSVVLTADVFDVKAVYTLLVNQTSFYLGFGYVR